MLEAVIIFVSLFLSLPEKPDAEKLGGIGAELRASYPEERSLCCFSHRDTQDINMSNMLHRPVNVSF